MAPRDDLDRACLRVSRINHQDQAWPQNADDVERFLAFVEMPYRDRVVGTDGLAPRRGC